jgi:hypothetical protein
MTKYVCEICKDTHLMRDSRYPHKIMCTRCPVPCDKCGGKSLGPYCTTTPCACACHFHAQRTQTKAVICKTCKGMGSPAPLRSICQDCQGLRVKLIKYTPSTKARLWRRVARLMGELAFGLHQNTKALGAYGVVQTVPMAKAFIRVGHQNCKTKKIAALLETALAAWEAEK